MSQTPKEKGSQGNGNDQNVINERGSGGRN
jgi:hypothetical protein